MGEISQPALYVFMGLPASGKSALAKVWAGNHQFSYFSFNVVRRQLAGVAEEIHAPQLIKRTYNALLTYAEQELTAGRTVVLAACYGSRRERERLARLADKIRIIPHFVLCYCSEKATRSRLEQDRSAETSTAGRGWRNYRTAQEKLDPLDDLEPTMVVSINTENRRDQLLEQLDYVFEKRPAIIIDSP